MISYYLTIQKTYFSSTSITPTGQFTFLSCFQHCVIVFCIVCLFDFFRCSYDYLELFDGGEVGVKSLGRFCGSRFNPISSSQPFLTLRFVTDNSSQMSGFKPFYNFTIEVISKHVRCHILKNCSFCGKLMSWYYIIY